jgi:hypothetical protein
MGCWNETCAFSRLPIHQDDPIVVIITSDTCRPYDSMYEFANYAVTTPLYGKYDDYGGIEDVTAKSLKAASKIWALQPIKTDDGKSIKLEDVELDRSIEASMRPEEALYLDFNSMTISKGGGFRNEVNRASLRINFILRDVWDAMLKAVREMEHTVHMFGQANEVLVKDFFDSLPSGKHSWKETTFGAFFDAAFDAMPTHIPVIAKKTKEIRSGPALKKLSREDVEFLTDTHASTLVNEYAFGLFARYGGHMMDKMKALELMAKHKDVREGVKELTFLAMAQIHGRCVMRSEVGCGSQNQNIDVQEAIFRTGLQRIEERKKLYEE